MADRLIQVLNGIARSMAPAGLTEALSFEAVRLASRERVQQRLPPGLRDADGGSVVGGRQPGIARRSGSTASEFAVSSGESWSARPGEKDTTNALGAAVVRPAGEVRPRGITKHSTVTESVIAVSSGEAGPSWPRAKSTPSAFDTAVT